MSQVVQENLLDLEKQSSDPIEQVSDFKPIPYRGFYFAFYSLNQLLIGTFLSAFTPILQNIQKGYDISENTIVQSSTLNIFGNLAIALFVYPLCQKMGLTNLMRLAIFLGFLGCLLRALINVNFIFVLIGQFILGLSGGLHVNTVIQFCCNLYSAEERPLYLAIVSIANVIGGGLSSTFPVIFVTCQNANKHTIRDQCFIYCISFTIIYAILFIVSLVFFDAEGQNKNKKNRVFKFKKGIKQLVKCFTYSLLRKYIFIYALSQTALTTFAAIANVIVVYFGFQTVKQKV